MQRLIVYCICSVLYVSTPAQVNPPAPINVFTPSEQSRLKDLDIDINAVLTKANSKIDINQKNLNDPLTVNTLAKLFTLGHTSISTVIIKASQFKDTQILIPLTNLTHLDLERNPINYEHLPQLIRQNCNSLEHVVLTGTLAANTSCKLNQLDKDWFLNTLSNICPQIQRIYLSGLPISLFDTNEQTQLFYTLEKLTLSAEALRVIQFRSNNIAYALIADFIGQLNRIPHELTLDFKQNPVSRHEKKTLSQQAHTKGIDLVLDNQTLKFAMGIRPLSDHVVANISQVYVDSQAKINIFAINKLKKPCIPSP